MAKVFLITPTGGRPEGMELLTNYLKAQTYQGPASWIIVDDVDPATLLPDSRFGVEVFRPSWRWKRGDNTQCRNMALALQQVGDNDTVIILEDDDAYLPEYLAATLHELEIAELVGERISRYYNVATRRWYVMKGGSHASLASVGVRGKALKLLRELCSVKVKYIDIELWKQFSGRKQLTGHTNFLGIKGLPGRAGIGIGHREGFGNPDTTNVLQKWLGDCAELYEKFHRV